ncbi:universal stress protein [Halorubrum sp. JWXQ-INN 858]|uniref:universal stress protein n=1 Tax=Halorubrum sp. JWXQ-INN 858 TaxID=2690782 RepID=UPI001357CB1D|nr:universal stress protein [Halorubrum sp. JWXQ-INN 858]MWV65505.1 universal stress protein [Halorubrum sp. JWXQ-INN 858]
MYDVILVATDGSDPANRAITAALEHAERFGATLHAVYVVDIDRYVEPLLSDADVAKREVEAWGSERLEEVTEQGRSLGVEVVTRCCHGKPSKEIINYADAIDADLVVIGYQGYAHADTDHIGSVADRVVRNAGRSVLIA